MVQHYLLLARRQQEEEEEEAAAAAAAAGDLNLISLGAYLHPSLHPVSPRLHFHPPHPRLSCLLLLLLLLLRSSTNKKKLPFPSLFSFFLIYVMEIHHLLTLLHRAFMVVPTLADFL